MFHNRQHLFQWLNDNLTNLTDRVLHNLLQGGGQTELLGGFDPLPGSKGPGWIVKLTSYRTGQTYYVCIGVSELTGQPRWWRTEAEKVCWQDWGGEKSKNPLYRGDDPERYRRLKNEETTKTKKL